MKKKLKKLKVYALNMKIIKLNATWKVEKYVFDKNKSIEIFSFAYVIKLITPSPLPHNQA